MPTLKNLSCQILWDDTGVPFKEYGTRYWDGIVETYIALPDKPQPFSISLTSNRFVHEGLAAVVFMDGTYHCNRNRVNLLRPKKDQPRERSQINFVLRQKEKFLGGGLCLGRQWRFDDHNIVPDPPQMSQGNHFNFLGTIEVIVLRCYGLSRRDMTASDASSATDSRVRQALLEPRADPRLNRQSTSRPPESRPPTKSDECIFGGLFDGASEPPEPRYYVQPCHRCHQLGLHDNRCHDSSTPFGPAPEPEPAPAPPPASRPRGLTKRVHFDNGPPSSSRVQTYAVTSTLAPEWTEKHSDVQSEPANPSYRAHGYRHSTLGLSEYHHPSQPQPFPPPQPVTQHPSVLDHDGSGISQDVPYPLPPPPFHFPISRMHSMPSLYQTPTTQPPQGSVPLGFIARLPPQEPHAVPETPVPPYHMYSPPHCYTIRNQPSGQTADCFGGHHKSSVSTVSSESGHCSSRASSDESTRDRGSYSNCGTNNLVGSGDARDNNQNRNPIHSDAQYWSNETRCRRMEQQKKKNGWQHPGTRIKATTATGKIDKGAHYSGRVNYWQTDGASGDHDTATAASSTFRSLYGPHGTYFAMRSQATPDDAACDAEEEPRYDVPQSHADKYRSTKQVQPGKGYIYTKKCYSPRYIDTIKNPYARFVFIYRTKEQLEADLELQLDSEPTGNEQVQKLQSVPKDELIQMLLRAKSGFGQEVPSPLHCTKAAGARTREHATPGPITFEPPDNTHLYYYIPEQPPVSGNTDKPAGRSSSNNNADSAINSGRAGGNPGGTTFGDMNQQSSNSAAQSGHESTDNQGMSWNNDYQNPIQNEDVSDQQTKKVAGGDDWNNDWNNDSGQHTDCGEQHRCSRDNVSRRDGSRCSTRSSRRDSRWDSRRDSRRGHDTSPELSAPLIAEGVDRQQPRGGVNLVPPLFPVGPGRWVPTSRGWMWQLFAYPRIHVPTPFGYGPPPFPSLPYQQYPSVQPGLGTQPGNPTRSPPQTERGRAERGHSELGHAERGRNLKKSSSRSNLSRPRHRDRVRSRSRHRNPNPNQTTDTNHQQIQPHSGDNCVQQTQSWQGQQRPDMGEAPRPTGGW